MPLTPSVPNPRYPSSKQLFYPPLLLKNKLKKKETERGKLFQQVKQ